MDKRATGKKQEPEQANAVVEKPSATIAFDVSSVKIGVCLISAKTVVIAETYHFPKCEQDGEKLTRFRHWLEAWMVKNVVGRHSVVKVAIEQAIQRMEGKTRANIVTKLAGYNIATQGLLFELLEKYEVRHDGIHLVPVISYKSLFYKMFPSFKALRDIPSKEFNARCIKALVSMGALVINDQGAQELLRLVKGCALPGDDDTVDAIVVGYYANVSDLALKAAKAAQTKRRARAVKAARRRVFASGRVASR